MRASTDDSTTFGDLLLRVGVSQSAEVQFGLTSFTHDRVRDRATGVVAHSSNVGDALVAVRRGIAGPNGPVAIEAFVSAPADHPGRWSAGVLLPASVDLPRGLPVCPDAGDRSCGRRRRRWPACGLRRGGRPIARACGD